MAELSRVLKRNGHFLISVFHPANATIGLMNTTKVAPEACIAAFVGVPLVLVWSLRRK